MAESIPLRSYKAPPGDDAGFLECTGCGFGDWLVVTRLAGDQRFIASVICSNCAADEKRPDNEVIIVNGLLED